MHASLAILGAFVFACGGAAASAQARSPEPRVFIARACPALTERQSDVPPVAIFVEVAEVTSKIEGAIDEWLATHPVEVRQAAYVMVPTELPRQATAPWRFCNALNCSSGTGGLTVVGQIFPGGPAAPVTLQLTFTGDAGRSESIVNAGNQIPVAANPTVPPGASTVIVTPYYLFAPKDQSVKELKQCKERSTR